VREPGAVVESHADVGRLKLDASTRWWYGLGSIAESAKGGAFGFVPFFYSQILGLSPALYGLASMIAQISDAVSDPVVGTLSDNTRGRWGRRHPWMLASTLPTAVCLMLLFYPPSGLGTTGLFIWVAGLSVALRSCLTMFSIPHNALGAELSTDYGERTRIVSYRATVSIVMSSAFPAFAYAMIFRSSPGEDGRLVVGNYTFLAMISAALAIAAVVGSCWGTRRTIPHLPLPATRRNLRLLDPFRDVLDALRNRNFRWIFLGFVTVGVSGGAASFLGAFTWAYFWQFETSTIGAILLLSLAGPALAFAAMPYLSNRFEKKHIYLWVFTMHIVNAVWWYGGRMLDLLPENGTAAIFVLAVFHQILMMGGVVIQSTLGPSMLADVADEHEVITGERKDGVFMAAMGFGLKAPLGFGHALGGLMLGWVGLAAGIQPSEVPPDVVFRLGVAGGPFIALTYVIPIFMISRYQIGRARHAELRRILDARKTQ
jgi:Na+/melibiose symporter-like transporter